MRHDYCACNCGQTLPSDPYESKDERFYINAAHAQDHEATRIDAADHAGRE